MSGRTCFKNILVFVRIFMVKIILSWFVVSMSISLTHACLRYEEVDLVVPQVNFYPMLSLKELAADSIVEMLLTKKHQETVSFFTNMPDEIKSMIKLALIKKYHVRCTYVQELPLELFFAFVRKGMVGTRLRNQK